MQMADLPTLSTQQTREVERLLQAEFHMSPLQTLENVGRSLALLAKQMLEDDPVDRSVVVLAGRGPNGGGGLAAARHLLNWGAWVQVLTSHPSEEYQNDAAHQLKILQAMDAPLAWAEEGWELPPADLVIDAIIGYGLPGNPRGQAPHLIRLANSSLAPILSLEAPSGFGTEQGEIFEPCVTAAATLILALPKHGHATEDAHTVCGERYLADIGVPLSLYERLGIDLEPIFAAGPLIKLD